MIDRNHFTEQAWNAIALSTQAASELGHNYVGTEHLLVGLCWKRREWQPEFWMPTV